jgi:hypothetical protein
MPPKAEWLRVGQCGKGPRLCPLQYAPIGLRSEDLEPSQLAEKLPNESFWNKHHHLQRNYKGSKKKRTPHSSRRFERLASGVR